MAPEFINWNLEGGSASINDLMKGDVWSLGMTLFTMLNPDLQYPYEVECKNQLCRDQSVFQSFLKNKYDKKEKPMMSSKYDNTRAIHWLKILELYELCTSFDPSVRQSFSGPVFRKLVEASIVPQYYNLKLSQASALENFDRRVAAMVENDGFGDQVLPNNDGTNCCTFMCIEIATQVIKCGLKDIACNVERIIDQLPVKINTCRDIETFYNVNEALTVMKDIENEEKYNIQFDDVLLSTEHALSSKSVKDLRVALQDMAKDQVKVGIYICQPYSMTIVSHEETMALIDTHPVPPNAGGNMSAMVIMTSKYNTDGILQWILKRIVAAGIGGQHQELSLITVQRNIPPRYVIYEKRGRFVLYMN